MAEAPTEPSVQDVVLLAITLHKSSHLEEAEQLYQAALKRAPDNVDALHYMGVLRHQQGQSDEAITLIRKALRSDPKYWGARINLGNVLKETGHYDQAAAEYRKVIGVAPKSADAHNNLGTILRLSRKRAEAIAAFQKAIELDDQHADAYQNLGNALKADGQYEEALEAYRSAIEIDKHHAAHLSLGRLLYRFGRIDEARMVYEKWLEIDPENPIAEHMLAACSNGDAPTRCSEGFVKQSFDAFASSFDEVLERLDYKAPALVEHAIAQALPSPTGILHVLDAGCGTGLCAAAIRPYAEQLIGIDLSPKMLEKAQRLELYNELHEAELTQFMAGQSESYDVILSADTLVYFGGLEEVFRAAYGALRQGGLFTFTVELLETEGDSERGFQLNPHGRYSHSEDYVKTCLLATGFTIHEITHEVLRMEVQQEVDGLVVSAWKRA